MLKDVISSAKKYHQELFGDMGNGHDTDHILRVENTAVDIANDLIAKNIKVNIDVVRLIALLHDVDDAKLTNTHIEKTNAAAFLKKHDVPADICNAVIKGLNGISYSDGKAPANIEAACVQDADRIDTLGAIGVTRAIQYGLSQNRPIFKPDRVYPIDIWTDNEYNDTSFDHVANKSVKVLATINTDKGLEIAKREFAITKQIIDDQIAYYRHIYKNS